jgi:hypothetical protein
VRKHIGCHVINERKSFCCPSGIITVTFA